MKISESDIERVARAICRNRGENPDRTDDVAIPTTAKSDKGRAPGTFVLIRPGRARWNGYASDARAAIEAFLDGGAS